MSRFPIHILLQSSLFTYPATYTNKAGQVKETTVMFERELSLTAIGETGFVNQDPVAYGSTQDFQDVSKGSTLTIHDTIEDENGDPLYDTNEEQIIGTNVVTYNIIGHHADADGMTQMNLSLN
jgi:hypothetical protein